MSSSELILSHIDHASSQPSLSFEFFPPRDEDGIAKLLQGAMTKLASYNPDSSLTYGAEGSTQ